MTPTLHERADEMTVHILTGADEVEGRSEDETMSAYIAAQLSEAVAEAERVLKDEYQTRIWQLTGIMLSADKRISGGLSDAEEAEAYLRERGLIDSNGMFEWEMVDPQGNALRARANTKETE